MGRFIDDNLIPGEKIVYKTTVHWMVYFPTAILLIIGLVLYWIGSSMLNIQGIFLPVLCSGFLILAIFRGLQAWIHRHCTEIAITDTRLIAKFGFIRRNVIELPLAKIESVTVIQGILERIINSGSVAARGTGMAMAPVKYIDSPIEFRNKLNAAIAEAKSA